MKSVAQDKAVYEPSQKQDTGRIKTTMTGTK